MSFTTPRTGQVLLLNGTSSSGKSSIAEQLLLILDRPFFHMPVDAINAMRARRRTLELAPDELAATLARTRAGFHRAVAGMAQAGNDLVVDYVLSEQWRLLDCLTVLNGLDVVFIGVHCSEQELTRRERARGDRQPGQAAAQLRQVHSYGTYDIECDTTTNSPRDCAFTIKQSLAQLPTPLAFDRLRTEFLPPTTTNPEALNPPAPTTRCFPRTNITV
ncbi:chloramphenicol phosphotransferase CPT family protein [Nonomuraea fuscirosea]|uniref:chloramphenicol phosphotransferase CPT family protein n=1 Tax=Nonomuraea fuscirosea TaxID=1291556 RepID=UPI0033DF8445